MKDLAIIIIGYKTRGLLKNCLNSIFENLKDSSLDYQVIVVDNHSQDGTIEMIKERFPQVKLIALDKNYGYARAVNKGIKAIEARYYFILNPDTLFLEKKVIDRLYQFMEENPKIGMVGPKLINPDKTIQPSCCRFPSFLIPLYRRTGLGKLPWVKKKIEKFLMLDWNHQERRPVDWVLGTGMFVRAEAIKEVGLMDERFFMFFEDTDWCRRFWEKNWPVYYFADAEIVHYHGRPSLNRGGIWDLFFNRGTRIHIQSWLKYFLKYLFKKKPRN